MVFQPFEFQPMKLFLKSTPVRIFYSQNETFFTKILCVKLCLMHTVEESSVLVSVVKPK